MGADVSIGTSIKTLATLGLYPKVRQVQGLPSLYLGQVATRCVIPQLALAAGTATWVQGRTTHWAMDDLVNPIISYPNFYVSTSNIETTVGAGTLKVALEYPDGTFNLSNENIAAGNTAVALPLGIKDFTFNLTVPAGGRFRLRPLITNAAGIVCVSQANGLVGMTGDGFNYGTGAPNDQTMGGAVSVLANYNYFPVRILSQTRRPSVLMLGDSRLAGLYDSPSDATGDTAYTRLIGQKFAYVSFGVPSTKLSNYISASRTYRNAIISYNGSNVFSHCGDYYGVNDTADSAATMAANRATIAALYPNMVVYGTTLPPYNTSTDNFATDANQSDSTSGKLAAFNTLVRAGIEGERFVLDLSDAVDPFRKGKWPASRDPSVTSGTANLTTPDGLHEKTIMYELQRDRKMGFLAAITR